ncbi:hypothetical protein F5B19DRAFT_342693 [Rostrohypoxylon terebratum]|nr:hypothetical protein F5B19DRAFT_342693 [Rostrohypoxylon terebratum]
MPVVVSKKERLARLNQALEKAHNEAKSSPRSLSPLPTTSPLPPPPSFFYIPTQPIPFPLLHLPPNPPPPLITKLISNPYFPTRPPIYITMMEGSNQLRKCVGCGNAYPWFQRPSIGADNIGIPHFVCQACTALTPTQRANEKAPFWSAIMNLWKPDVDDRASKFVVLDQNSTALLCCLHELAKHYSWQDVTSMVNSIVMERLRHGPNVHWRYAVETDFYDVWESCHLMQFPPVMPDAMQADELQRAQLALGPFGLVVPEPGTPDPTATACPGGWMCANILPCLDRIVYTYAYRNRRGCAVQAHHSADAQHGSVQGGAQSVTRASIQADTHGGGAHDGAQANPQSGAQAGTQGTTTHNNKGLTLQDILN